MGFTNKKGETISYECSELIEELKADIKEFGGDTIVAVWCKEYKGVVIYTNYDFIDKEKPIKKSELMDGEFIKKMTMTGLLIVLEKQNEII
jgi:hypothetical protein